MSRPAVFLWSNDDVAHENSSRTGRESDNHWCMTSACKGVLCNVGWREGEWGGEGAGGAGCGGWSVEGGGRVGWSGVEWGVKGGGWGWSGG